MSSRSLASPEISASCIKILKQLISHTSNDQLLLKVQEVYQITIDNNQQYFSSTGFQSYDKFITFLKENSDKVNPKLIDDILNENVEFTINTDRNIRESIKENGFLNFHITNTTNGTNDINNRSKSEASLLSLSKSEYQKLSPLVKPKYGSLRAGKNSILKQKYHNIQYGDDVYVFKKNSVKNRVTFTLKDSLELGYMSARGLPKTWSSQFIPWERRGLMIPLLIDQLAKDEPILETGYQSALSKFKIKSSTLDQLAPEVQIWGTLSLDDVEKYIFLEKAPRGDFLQVLINKNIKIFDGRDSSTQPQLWSP